MGKLTLHQTNIDGINYVCSNRQSDNRGSFSRWFCQKELSALLPNQSIVQINHSVSAKAGTVRGFHFQYPPYAEYKLVRCIAGAIIDIGVDLRAGSDTFLQHVMVELSEDNDTMLIVPPGCAHGFQTLTDDVELLYLHTAFYSPEAEGGLRYDDPTLKINWPLPITCLSERDKSFTPLEPDYTGLTL